MGRPEDFESSQLLLQIVARAPLAVYKYLALLLLFLFLITHPSFGFYQNALAPSPWCALAPAPLHYFLQKLSRSYAMVCVPSASSSGFLQKVPGSVTWCAPLPASIHHFIQKKTASDRVYGVRSSFAFASFMPKTSLDNNMVRALSAPRHQNLPKKYEYPPDGVCFLLRLPQNTAIYPKYAKSKGMCWRVSSLFEKVSHDQRMSPFLEPPKTYHYGRHGCGKSRETAVEVVHGRSRKMHHEYYMAGRCSSKP